MKYQIYRDGEPREAYPAALFNNSPAGALEEYCRVYGLALCIVDFHPANGALLACECRFAPVPGRPNRMPTVDDLFTVEVREVTP